MKKFRWQLIVVLLALLAIGALLLSQPGVTQPGPEVVNQPISGGVYSEALIGQPSRFNPILDYYNQVDYDVDRLIFSSLVRFDHRGLPQGDLATGWGISQDGKTYNISINSAALWHDGQPVTSEDILFTIELLRNLKVPLPSDLHAFWKLIEVEALDEHMLQFRLPEPFAPFMDYLTFGILPKHILGDMTVDEIINAPFNLKPIGSGPYQLRELHSEGGRITSVVLGAFKGYYAQKPFIEQIVFRYYPDALSCMTAYERGEVMGISHITPEILPQALRAPHLNMFSGRLPYLSMIFLNLDDPKLPFFQDRQVRRALLMGINRPWIVDKVLGGQGIIAHGPIFPESWAYYQGIEHIEYDPEAAIKLLKDADYTVPAEGSWVRAKEGVPLSFELVFPEDTYFSAIAERIRTDWQLLGVEVKLKQVTYQQLMDEHLRTRNYQAALVELNFSRSPDPDPYPFWHQSQIVGGQNYAKWDDRQVSEYLEQARVMVDLNERAKRYRNFQVRFAIELPALPLFFPVYSYGIDDQVQGVSVGPFYDPSDRFSALTSWYLVSGISTRPTLRLTVTP